MIKKKIEEYFKQLEDHDWYYEWSDSHSVYTAGSESLRVISEIAASDKTAGKMFDAFRGHYFSGQAFGTKRTPKPKIEDFLRKGVAK